MFILGNPPTLLGSTYGFSLLFWPVLTPNPVGQGEAMGTSKSPWLVFSSPIASPMVKLFTQAEFGIQVQAPLANQTFCGTTKIHCGATGPGAASPAGPFTVD